MVKLSGTHTHQPTGKVMTIDWEYEETAAGKATWRYRLRHGGKVLEAKEGTADFDATETNAAAACLAVIRDTIDKRAHLFSL